MKCLIFVAPTPIGTVDAYSKWAEHKMLAKDVIIHSHAIKLGTEETLIILVFFDEIAHPSWIGAVDV